MQELKNQTAITAKSVRFIRNIPFRTDGISPQGVHSQELVAGGTIFMKKEIISPKAQGIPHYHPGPTAIYMLVGKVRVNYGLQMECTDTLQAGEALFIPAEMPHQPVNESGEETAECIVVRDTPTDVIIPWNPNS